MTDLFAYHVAREQMADVRRTAGQTRLTSTANNHRSLRTSYRVISRLLSRMSTPVSDHRTAGGASQIRPIRTDAPNDPARTAG